jgi:hypothetical protein
MHSHVRVSGAIAAIMILAGCTTSGANMKPTAQTSAAAPAGCLTSTGSHIPPSDSYCTGLGSSYSSQDINRTGKTTVGDALPLLDPTVTVRH